MFCNSVLLSHFFGTENRFDVALLLTTSQEQIGIDGTDTLRYQAIDSVIGLLEELLIMLFVDKVGRRTIITWGNLAMCLTYITSTILLAQYPPSTNNTGADWACVVMTWLFNFTIAQAWLPM